MSSTSPAQTVNKPRFTWVDTSRGLAMFMVVVHHIIMILTPKADIVLPAWLDITNHFILLLVMPSFCLISGLFIGKTHRESNDLYWRNRVGTFVYLYVLWSLVYICLQFGRVFTGMSWQQTLNSVWKWVSISIGLNTGLWYFAALIVFYVYYRLTYNLPKILHLVVLIPLYFLYSTDMIKTESWGWDHIIQYSIYFMVGAWFGPQIISGIPSFKNAWMLILTLGLGMVYIAYALLIYPNNYGWAELLLGPFAVLWFLKVCELVNKLPGRYQWRKFGKITLPIYVLHVAVLEIAAIILAKIVPSGVMNLWQQIVLPVAAPIFTTLVCLVVWKATNRFLPWLYELPEIFKVSQGKHKG